MATWLEISNDIAANGQDTVRRSKIKNLFELTGRPVLLYAVEMFNKPKLRVIGGDTAIDLSDKDGFIEALRGIEGHSLDLVLHSPGGSPEATETLVKLLREKFDDIRFLVPNVAKSAATMFAMSGNEIVLGNHAELGPTDPQFVINNHFSPAHAILEQFETAKKELGGNSNILPAWLPILEQYGPSLLEECNSAIKLTQTLVKEWLSKYMFQNDPILKRKAAPISKFLASKKHYSHSRAISIDDLKSKGVKIKKASECSPDLLESLQDINYSILLTFNSTGAYKIFENHLGKGFYRVIQPMAPQQIQAQRRPG